MKHPTLRLVTAALSLALLVGAPGGDALAQSAPSPPAAPVRQRSPGAALAGFVMVNVGVTGALIGGAMLTASLFESCADAPCPDSGLNDVGVGLGVGGAAFAGTGLLLLFYGAAPAARARASLAPTLLAGASSVALRWSF
jgi:hypothetical protein